VALLAIMSERKKKTLPRLSSRVPESFKERVEDLKTELQRRRRWFYNGEKLSEEGIVATAVLEFLSLTIEQQGAILDRHIPAIEAMFDAMKTVGPEGESGRIVIEPEREEEPRKLKRKGAG
jgi:hypothetical protein